MPAAHALAEILTAWAAERDSLEILDIACGGGLYSLTLAARHPQARTTLLDWANVLELARAHVEKIGLVDRTGYVEGDGFEVPLGGPYDFLPGGSRPADEPFPFLFSVVMLTWTRDGEASQLSTYERLLSEAGFGAHGIRGGLPAARAGARLSRLNGGTDRPRHAP